MFPRSFVSCLGLTLAVLTLQASAQTTGVSLLHFFTGPQFVDSGGNPLVAADPNSHPGQGDLIQVGYFAGITNSTPVSNFGANEWATFTPLTGDGSSNPHIMTQVGAAGLGGPSPLGYFSVAVTLDGTDAQPVYTNRIGVRIFDGNSEGSSSNYTTVASETWFMPAISSPPPQAPIFNFGDPNILVFQGATPYMTDIPLVPEPSSALLLLMASGLWLHRRRS